MRLRFPRIDPLDDDELDDEQREVLKPFGNRVLNIFRTLAHAPKALKRFNVWGGYILSDRNSLTPREREIAILRTGWLCGAGYEWTQHVILAREAGLSEGEIWAIGRGPKAPGWSSLDAAILTAADELVRDHFITDATWAALAPLGHKARMDVVFTVGQYTQVSMFLNTFGVQLDLGQTLDPAFPKRPPKAPELR
ncbi:MAG: carboxymuconolactone decarboxylase family protein [Pseudomonadota bacterium]|nr:carboxymuconolactone decarboxylase family protein [Pseudomonadota bacterium]